MDETEFGKGELRNAADMEMARVLKSLSPAAARVDAINAAIDAGRRIERRRTRIWQGTTFSAVMLCAALWISAADRATPKALSAPQWTSSARTVVEPLPAESEARLQAAVELPGLAGLPPLDRAADQPVHVSDFF
jgi:hypothetical protein